MQQQLNNYSAAGIAKKKISWLQAMKSWIF
jgi:hypothetical protein